MSPVTRHEAVLVVFLFAMVLIPVGIVILVGTHVPYYPVSGEPVGNLLDAEDISIVSVKESQWDMPGAAGGKTYVIVDKDNRQTIIATQNFESAASRDAAIRSWHTGSTGRGKPAGSLFVIGQHLVVVSPSDRPVLESIRAKLKEYLE